MTTFTRREWLWLVGVSSAHVACGSAVASPKPFTLPKQEPSRGSPEVPRYADSVDALFDVLLPAERDAATREVVSAGARETNADALLRQENLVRLAIEQGFLPPMPEVRVSAFDALHTVVRSALNRDLDVLASLESPLTPFADLPRAAQERIVTRAFDDPARAPTLQVMRAVCFLAFHGAGGSDLGLRALGFPPFEDLGDGLAVSGYPRITDGRVDDYTFNQAPMATVGDDLSLVLTPEGDLR